MCAIMTPFHIGMKVVCIEDLSFPCLRALWPNGWPIIPKIGKTYTVRDVFIDSDTNKLGLRLVEIRCGISGSGVECGFSAVYFRPIVVTNIDVFTAMLAPAPKQTVSA